MNNFQADEKLREQFVQLRQSRDIFRMTPPYTKMSHLQNLPKAEQTCPVEARFYRGFGVRIVNKDIYF